jgi:hypothetical protein
LLQRHASPGPLYLRRIYVGVPYRIKTTVGEAAVLLKLIESLSNSVSHRIGPKRIADSGAPMILL